MKIENILRGKPGGKRILNEYARTKSLTDSRRRDMVKILVAHMTSEHGTSPSRRVKEEYARGITALFPYSADPRSRFGYEHFYNAQDGSGYLAWRLKFVQKEVSEGQKRTGRQSPTQRSGPEDDREPFVEENWLNTDILLRILCVQGTSSGFLLLLQCTDRERNCYLFTNEPIGLRLLTEGKQDSPMEVAASRAPPGTRNQMNQRDCAVRMIPLRQQEHMTFTQTLSSLIYYCCCSNRQDAEV